VKWIELVQDRVHWWVLVLVVLSLKSNEVAEVRFMRRTVKCTRMDYKRNEDLLKKTKTIKNRRNIGKNVGEIKMNCIQHVGRKQRDRPSKLIKKLQTKGTEDEF